MLRGKVHDLVIGRASQTGPWKRGARAILTDEARNALEGIYGVHADGTIEPLSRLPRLNDDAEAAETYRRIIAHLAAERSAGLSPREAVDKLIKEVAFTHLNRFVAFKMLEARKLIRGTLARYPQSNGFLRYLADHPDDNAKFDSGDNETAFRHFLLWQAGQIASEIRVLFDPENLPSRLFPRQQALREVIAMLNDASMEPAWNEDETIGWVYQYFNEEEKADVFERLYKQKQKLRRADVPAATQLFTPRWIVEFLVQNSLGRTWLQMHPDSNLAARMDFLVPLAGEIPAAPLKPVREITVLDPACGTMHFGLVAFDLLAEMYREEIAHAGEPGWPAEPSIHDDVEIPTTILEHNLFGMDIDLRAVQLAAFSLYLKAKQLNPQAKLTATNLVSADVLPFRRHDLDEFLTEMRFSQPVYERVLRALWPRLAEVTEMGSLARLERQIGAVIAEERRKEQANPLFADTLGELGPTLSTDEQWSAIESHIEIALGNYAKSAADRGSDVTFFTGEATKGLRLLEVMRRKYDVVVCNPPYLTNFTDHMKALMARDYPIAKSDTYAAFIVRCEEWLNDGGRVGMITQQSFMFLSSYEKLREKLLDEVAIESMAHTGPGAFEELGGEVVNTTLFTLRAEHGLHKRSGSVGTYIRLVGEAQKLDLLRMKLQPGNQNVQVEQNELRSLPGSPWVYWIAAEVRNLFSELSSLASIAQPRQGLITGDNFRFLRYWWEVGHDRIKFNCESREEARLSGARWFPYTKGGHYRRWYGNLFHAVNWYQDGLEITNLTDAAGRQASRPQNLSFYFREGVNWSRTASSAMAARHLPPGVIFDCEAASAFPTDPMELMGIMNAKLTQDLLAALNPSIHFQIGDVGNLPVPELRNDESLSQRAKAAVQIQKQDARSDETTYDFSTPGDEPTCKRRAVRLRAIELEIDRLVALAYGLTERAAIPRDVTGEEVVSAEVADTDNESDGEATDPQTKTLDKVRLRQISYAVGIILGRFQPGVDGALGSAIVEQEDGTAEHQFSPGTEAALRALADPDGIVPLDEGHPDDLAAKVETALHLMLGDAGAAEVIAAVDGDIPKFLKSEFWTKYHLRWYRKRPVYWFLQSPKKHYGLYLFHERVGRETLFVVQGKRYVQGKLNSLADQAARLRTERDTLIGAPRTKKQKELDTVEAIRADIEEFARRLRAITEFGYDPDLDDGVILNLAPLRGVLPSWSAEPAKYWKELEDGKYDWAHIAMRYWPERVEEKCKTDKSLAIAHNRLDLYEGV